MADYQNFKVGGVTFPLEPGLGATTLLQRADPAIYYALDFFASVLRTYCGEAWAEACTAAGLTQLATADSIVRQTFPYDPVPDLQTMQHGSQLPLLALYRTDATFKDLTAFKRQSTDEFYLEYILPPLGAAQKEILLPILNAIEKCLIDRAYMGFDPDHDNGNRVFWGYGGGLTSFQAKSRKYQRVQLRSRDDSLHTEFRSLLITFEVIEQQFPEAAADSFELVEGIDVLVQTDTPGNAEEGIDPVTIAEVQVDNV